MMVYISNTNLLLKQNTHFQNVKYIIKQVENIDNFALIKYRMKTKKLSKQSYGDQIEQYNAFKGLLIG